MKYIKLDEEDKTVSYFCLDCKIKYLSKIKRTHCPECNKKFEDLNKEEK